MNASFLLLVLIPVSSAIMRTQFETERDSLASLANIINNKKSMELYVPLFK